jgi:hypothetical protein
MFIRVSNQAAQRQPQAEDLSTNEGAGGRVSIRRQVEALASSHTPPLRLVEVAERLGISRQLLDYRLGSDRVEVGFVVELAEVFGLEPGEMVDRLLEGVHSDSDSDSDLASDC